ncbi:MAG: hypothetical protein R6V36_08675 [Psychroflexus sp.]
MIIYTEENFVIDSTDITSFEIDDECIVAQPMDLILSRIESIPEGCDLIKKIIEQEEKGSVLFKLNS